ncbi:MAG TPA: hypothetical protein VM070_04020 [Candidatus Saccharimonadales bacterium]|nr:hypothetical protein [Candidatus Saccharimonadales bacterium]
MFVVATRDPDRMVTVLAAIAGVAVTVGALVAALLVMLTSRRRRSSGREGSTLRAVRRGVIAGSVVGLVAILRVIDGLTPLTAAFVVGTFLLAEVVLSARTT